MHLTPMPSALLARRLRSRLWCQKQVGAGDRGRSLNNMTRFILVFYLSLSTSLLSHAAGVSWNLPMWWYGSKYSLSLSTSEIEKHSLPWSNVDLPPPLSQMEAIKLAVAQMKRIFPKTKWYLQSVQLFCHAATEEESSNRWYYTVSFANTNKSQQVKQEDGTEYEVTESFHISVFLDGTIAFPSKAD